VNDESITPRYSPGQVAKTPPCQAGCLNCGDIRGWIQLVAQRRKMGLSREQAFERAWRRITEVNPFPATLGRICPHPCESTCNRGSKDEPLAINAMERFLGDYAIETCLSFEREQGPARRQSLAVIGAGPAGLSFAYQMARRGYPVNVYESREPAGGMLRYGVPDYRLPPEVLDAEIRRILELGVTLETGVAIGRDISLDTLRQRHDAVFLGIGAQQGRGLSIPGAEGPGVQTATAFLERMNSGEAVHLGEHVIVVGGGNSAMDAARSARRTGATVHLLYRRSLAEMPATPEEVELAAEEGVELLLLSTPIRIEHGDDGRLRRVEVTRVVLGELDSSGRRRPAPVEGSEYWLEADSVILATSQLPDRAGFEALFGDGRWLVAGERGGLVDGLLAGGDALGLGMAGNAIVQGRHAAEQLHARFSVNEDLPAENLVSTVDPDQIRTESRDAGTAARPDRIGAAERLRDPLAETERTLDAERFLSEVERCFSCGSCFGCEQCSMYCTSGCYTRLSEVGPGTYFSLTLDACQACGKCVEVCPCGFLEVV
jgi:NADPH-dependent glutamate synthase beta subunit-like oxidoreductase/Pyruvate/2-oxoacid:ferredoxin oxidoreductase delta subunit